ncbi:elongation factor Ts [Armatimonadetes bacterium GBS]|jgi:elongation factor Ts|nr:MAG: elongation factor Ts [Fimbriimonadales bacterium]CUU06868.1 elongation factor Ts [Armatimonadetes bacterium GBS]CUU33877.1 elongation factor Ts [Armatimonadetes bacterium GXS]
MSITPQMIKELRDETGAGFMDCKQALEQAGGDMEEARKILRQKGAVIATKRASKEVNQGVIAGKVSADGRTGVLIDLRCETDFVARNEEFLALAEELLQAVEAFGQEGQLETLLQQPAPSDSSLTLEKRIELVMGKTGERIALQNYAIARVPEGANGVVDVYIHHNKMVGVMVVLTGSADTETLRQLAHEVAIQIAWSTPSYISKDEIPQEELQKELEIEKQRALNEGKPEQVAENIARGRVQKGYIQKVALLEQPYYRDESKTIGALLKEKGADITVQRFVRLEVGSA